MTVVYLDSSAFIKTIAEEPEAARLKRWLRPRPDRASCALVRTEAALALRRHGSEALAHLAAALEMLWLIRLDDELLDAAGRLPVDVRSLDALHIAAAQSLGSELGFLVTYDVRMTRAATALGIEVASP